MAIAINPHRRRLHSPAAIVNADYLVAVLLRVYILLGLTFLALLLRRTVYSFLGEIAGLVNTIYSVTMTDGVLLNLVLTSYYLSGSHQRPRHCILVTPPARILPPSLPMLQPPRSSSLYSGRLRPTTRAEGQDSRRRGRDLQKVIQELAFMSPRRASRTSWTLTRASTEKEPPQMLICGHGAVDDPYASIINDQTI
ncbi:hypothetical protein L226DRAFT_572137 [Lentinus tigrinus ALCF2SS1-7]|uniref:Uncharacterized protein n=1 Tax=Lentinus tigrinus ALCF2SS1-6 TaxID=1328759 RepID=A0A5C2S7S7_9APHY|nr:hypothetical protein L227DRAFT_612127 [Lentinus tigrinus ALCF2SS1-6]RPD73464.1 hypothetical protein L226DRAFT_572137 [Lentinus tigrinus ALCF2SS1-7]